WQNLPQRANTPQGRETGPQGIQSDIAQTGQQTGVQQYDMDLSAPQQTTQTANEPGFAGERQRIEEGLFARMQPQHAMAQDALRTRLANQGLTEGSEAYNREMSKLSESQAAERFNALQTGGAEQQRMQQMLLGQQQQAFGQDQASQAAQNTAMQGQFG